MVEELNTRPTGVSWHQAGELLWDNADTQGSLQGGRGVP